MTRYEILVDYEDEYHIMETTLKRITMLAHQAVLFEKIKQKINEEEGDRIEKIAEILVNGSRNYVRPESELDRWINESEEELIGAEDED